jgi:hypothetical protein
MAKRMPGMPEKRRKKAITTMLKTLSGARSLPERVCSFSLFAGKQMQCAIRSAGFFYSAFFAARRDCAGRLCFLPVTRRKAR